MSPDLAQPEPAQREPIGRRDRRKAETRRRLLVAARSLFVERGYDATRPQDIAREADVAAGTFYLHFDDKRAAFLAFTDEAAQELMDSLRSRKREDVDFEQSLFRALEGLLAYSDANPGVLRAAFADEAVIASGSLRASLRDRLAENLAEGLEDGMRRGAIHRDYDPLLTAYAIVGLIQQALVHGSHAGLGRKELLANVTRFCSRALLRERPRGTRTAAPGPRVRGSSSR